MRIYEENVRVPMFFALPSLERTMRAPQVASVIDLAPTLAALAGVTPPSCWNGSVLLEPRPGVARFFTDHSLTLLGLRQAGWKLIIDASSGRSELYWLPDDPLEQRNLAHDQPERVARYRAHLDAWSHRGQ
jgi:arylsulfatase A-like enzyme